MTLLPGPLYDEALIPMEDHQKKDEEAIYNSYNINQGESGAMLFPEKRKALCCISCVRISWHIITKQHYKKICNTKKTRKKRKNVYIIRPQQKQVFQL